ncbi:hypothetical protein [Fibrobacter sp. UWR2]|uniref:glucuronyl esterase domain-containing protein n=1 Tax=Fibrobacter sp. UWR2 TaxID=1964352 RepID=UPI000B522FE3|nr:hypothetical protein [Fibrobacter sp. UWR2]OWV01051.1 hypothetical protein B7994_04535 [Fibrobacter sp. UWR2]
MNKRKFLFPVALVAIGLWACGEETNVGPETCTTPDCIAAQEPEPASSATVPPVGDTLSSSSVMGQEPHYLGDQDSLKDTTQAMSSSAVLPQESSSSTIVLSSSTLPPVTSSSSYHHHRSSSSSVVKPVESSSSAVVVPPTPGNDFVEDHRSECQIGDIPTSVNNAKLPDPFKGLDGKRISTKDEWKCRREEIGAMYEKIMFGQKPRNPEKVEGSFSGGKLKVSVTDKGKSISFSVSISGGGTKDKPKPGIIGFASFGGCGSLGASTNGLGVAMISFNPDDVAPENGGGSFFQLYGGSDAGTAIAWAWGISRVIDALEKTPEAGIDVHHLGVTGCSRHGKGSLIAGAFDERIALVIPQESGSGGASLWRSIAQVNRQKGTQFVQGLASAGTEGRWMKSSFKNYDGKETTLPFDQHMLTAMVAPRALLLLDNQSFDWLGEVPSNYCGNASLEVFKALGIEDNYTYAQKGGHDHCSLPQDHYDEVKAYVNAFLNESGTTKGKVESFSSVAKWNKSEWIDWDTPNLK